MSVTSIGDTPTAGIAEKRRWRYTAPWLLLLAPAILFLTALFFYPVLQVLWLSVIGGSGALTTENYAKLGSSPAYLQSLWVTFNLSFWTTVICDICW